MTDVLGSKLLALTALTSGSLLLGLAPLVSARCADRSPSLRRTAAQSLALCAGAGVLLATALAHILPELRPQLPSAEPIFCAGFFLMQLAEEAVQCLQSLRCRQRQREHPTCAANFDEQSPLLAAPSAIHDATTLAPAPCPGDDCALATPPPAAPASTLGLLVALSVHSALEGAAVGLQSTPARVWLLAAAVAAHKLAVALCLGLELRQSVAPRAHAIAVAVFAGSCAAGVAAGTFAQVGSSQLPWLQALAGGSLLYVAVSEVLPRERARLQGRAAWAGLAQLAAAIVGFCLALVLTQLVEANDDDDLPVQGN